MHFKLYFQKQYKNRYCQFDPVIHYHTFQDQNVCKQIVTIPNISFSLQISFLPFGTSFTISNHPGFTGPDVCTGLTGQRPDQTFDPILICGAFQDGVLIKGRRRKISNLKFSNLHTAQEASWPSYSLDWDSGADYGTEPWKFTPDPWAVEQYPPHTHLKLQATWLYLKLQLKGNESSAGLRSAFQSKADETAYLEYGASLHGSWNRSVHRDLESHCPALKYPTESVRASFKPRR